ncbi:MAG TPA: methyltransferase domain-containing protein [Verrucomicrobiae bacterium]
MDLTSRPFEDAQAVARYAEGPPRLVPGFSDLQRMARHLIAEKVSATARLLILGAGGGLEIQAFATAQPGWEFDGVDPSTEMLKLAATATASFGPRVRLQQGYIEQAPAGPFDAATCLLTLHFVPSSQRVRTLREIQQRLKPGAPLVVAHMSFPQGPGQRAEWLARYVAFGVGSGIDPVNARRAAEKIDKELTILTPEADEADLRAAGFQRVDLFYTGFCFRGWVAYANS